MTGAYGFEQDRSPVPGLGSSTAVSLIWNDDWDSQSSRFQEYVEDSGATVGQMCSKTMKGKTSKAMGAEGKLGIAVLSKLKAGGCSFMGKGVSPYGGVPYALDQSFLFLPGIGVLSI